MAVAENLSLRPRHMAASFQAGQDAGDTLYRRFESFGLSLWGSELGGAEPIKNNTNPEAVESTANKTEKG